MAIEPGESVTEVKTTSVEDESARPVKPTADAS